MSTLSELIPSGGTQNNIEFVAQGTLANGQTVALRSDGKVEAIAVVAGSVGSIVAYGSTNQNEIAATYDSTNNKVVLTALNGSGYGTATVGTVSGSSISFGSPVVFNSGGTLFINIGFDSSNSKVVIAYQDQGNGGKGTAIVGTVSGTSISFGSEVVFKTSDATSNAVAFDSNSNKIVITYVGGASTYYGYAVVGTVSGTSISFGSEATWNGANSYSAERGSATFDTLTNQIIVVQRVSGNTGRVCVGAVSGTSISFGSAVQIGSGTAYTPSVSYDSNNNKVVIAYKDGNNSNYGTAIVGTVSGNGITLGTAAVFQSFATTYTATTFDSTQKVVVVTFSDGEGSSGKGAALPLIVSGTTVSGGDKTNYTSVASYFMAATFDTTAQKSVFAFKEMSSGYPNSVTYVPPSTNASSFIGITNAAISSGATGEVAVKGGLSTGGNLLPYSLSFGSSVVFESSSAENIEVVYDSNAQKVVAVYKDSQGYVAGAVGTVNGTSITYGSPVRATAAGGNFYTSAVYDSSNNKVVAFYRNNSNAYSQVGTVSGTSISWGTAVVFGTANTNDIKATFDSNSNKAVVTYSDAGNSNYGTAIVGTVSGTSISFGSAVVFETSYWSQGSVTFDSSNNKVVAVGKGLSNYGRAIVGTVSGTSISFGSGVTFDTGNTSWTSCTFDSSNNKVVIGYNDGNNSTYGTAIVGTVSGTSISFGTSTVFDSGSSTSYISVTFDSSLNKVLISFKGASSDGFSIQGTVSGTSISFGTAAVFEAAAISWLGSAYDANAQKVVLAFQDTTAGDGESLVVNPTNALTIGSNYFVQDDGSIATTSSTTKAGKAISTTALNLVDPT